MEVAQKRVDATHRGLIFFFLDGGALFFLVFTCTCHLKLVFVCFFIQIVCFNLLQLFLLLAC